MPKYNTVALADVNYRINSQFWQSCKHSYLEHGHCLWYIYYIKCFRIWLHCFLMWFVITVLTDVFFIAFTFLILMVEVSIRPETLWVLKLYT